MKLILASASPRRRELLAEVTPDFQIVQVDAEEYDSCVWPERLPLLNASNKANSGAALYPDALVIGADTVIELDGQLIGKPRDAEHARQILQKLSDRTHLVTTGVSLICIERKIRCSFVVSTAVTFKPLSDEVIQAYLGKVHVLDKAGAYGIQEHGDMLTKKIDGPLDNVIGLPCEKLKQALKACGFSDIYRQVTYANP
jgi:nucleoside triphosphate pyrophosphatase